MDLVSIFPDITFLPRGASKSTTMGLHCSFAPLLAPKYFQSSNCPSSIKATFIHCLDSIPSSCSGNLLDVFGMQLSPPIFRLSRCLEMGIFSYNTSPKLMHHAAPYSMMVPNEFAVPRWHSMLEIPICCVGLWGPFHLDWNLRWNYFSSNSVFRALCL